MIVAVSLLVFVVIFLFAYLCVNVMRIFMLTDLVNNLNKRLLYYERFGLVSPENVANVVYEISTKGGKTLEFDTGRGTLALKS
jgi:hypothetical protein